MVEVWDELDVQRPVHSDVSFLKGGTTPTSPGPKPSTC